MTILSLAYSTSGTNQVELRKVYQFLLLVTKIALTAQLIRRNKKLQIDAHNFLFFIPRGSVLGGIMVRFSAAEKKSVENAIFIVCASDIE